MARAMTHTPQTVTAAIEAAGVVAVIRTQEPDRLRAVIDALADGGVRALEVTMTVPGAIELIEGLSSALSDDFLLGAGTVLDPQTAARVIGAGARFVVSPILRPAIIDVCHRHGVAALPGCFSPDGDSDPPGSPAPTSSRCSRQPRSVLRFSRTYEVPFHS
jgi:2-dehydro-3-deoxyphosphogluconate aldolase/(4S)-4-hydroxy-2-oxoglutarate aldolase